MHSIIHQTQPSYNSCVSTCLAMLAHLPATDITRKYNDRYHADPCRVSGFMEELGLGWETTHPTADGMEWGHVYLLGVPSINIAAVGHQIVCDLRSGSEVRIYDPAKGRVGDDGVPRKHYIYDPEWVEGKTYIDPYAMHLRNYTIEAKIVHAPALGFTSPLGAGDHTYMQNAWMRAKLAEAFVKDVGVVVTKDEAIKYLGVTVG